MKRNANGLGSRIVARFTKRGLTKDLPKLRGQPPRPADFSEDAGGRSLARLNPLT